MVLWFTKNVKVQKQKNQKEGPGRMEGKRRKNLKEVRTLKTLQRIIVALTLTFIYVGCSGCAYLSARNGGDSKLSNISNSEKNEADRPPILSMGSKFIYKDTSLSDGKAIQLIMEVKEKKEFEQKQAYWIEVFGEGMSYFNIYDMNLNWIGLFGEGKKLESAQPCIQIFKWPLRVGTKWVSDYYYRNYSGVFRSNALITSVNIRTYEEVTVPAGTFKTLRIQADGDTYWYAPSIGWIVKEQIGSYYTRRNLDLVEYNIPRNM